jgi:hypothetical protein
MSLGDARDEENLLAAATTFFEQPGALDEQDAYVRRRQLASGASRLGRAIPLAVIAAILVPVLLVWSRSLPSGGRGPVLIFAIGLAVGAAVLIVTAIKTLVLSARRDSATAQVARSLDAACEAFYASALCLSSEGLSMKGRDDHLREVAYVFPKPVLEGSLPRLHTIAALWEELRAPLGPKDQRLGAMQMSVKASPAAVPHLRDVEVTLRIHGRDRPLVLTNTALNIQGRWYLLRMEPVMEPVAVAQVHPEDDDAQAASRLLEKINRD